MRQSDLIRCEAGSGKTIEGDAPVDASASSIHGSIYEALGRGKLQEGGTEGGVEAIVSGLIRPITFANSTTYS